MIIFYSGSDAYRLRSAVILATTRIATDHGPTTQTVIIDAAGPEGRIELERVLKYPPFFQEHICAVVKDPFTDAQAAQSVHDLLDQYHQAIASEVTLILCQPGAGGRESEAARTLKAFLGTHASESTVFEPLKGVELVRWMQAHCNTRTAQLSASTASALIQRIGSDSWTLANELNKLCAYAGQEEITPEMVRLLVAERRELDDFQLANALAAKDKRGAITALWSQIHSGTAEQLLLGSMAYSIRTLLSVQDLVNRHMPAAMISKTTGLAPFAVSRTLRSVSAYQTNQLLRTHAALAALDRDTKSGRADITDELFSLLLNL